MSTKKTQRFAALMGLQEVKPRTAAALAEILKTWQLLHPHLAAMNASETSLAKIRDLMAVELAREEGPRAHIMDRLYMRFSSLRREMETTAMAAAVPDYEDATE